MLKQVIISVCLLLVIVSSAFSDKRIINGSNASEAEWPWMAALFQTGAAPEDLGTGQFCGGTLIAPDMVLTAAHCVADFIDYSGEISVVVGRTRLSSGSGEIAKVKSFLVHPDYDPQFTRFDFAVLKLESPLSITPIQLIAANESALWDDNSPATALGWGQTDPQNFVYPDILQEVVLPIHSDTACSANMGRLFSAESQICGGLLSSANHLNDGTDVCYGDSGGPLVVFNGSNWKLVGLTSWGFECAGPQYGVYSRVAAVRDWLTMPLDFPPTATSLPTLVSDLYIDEYSIPVGATLSCQGAEFDTLDGNLSYTFTVISDEMVETFGSESNSFTVLPEQQNTIIDCSVTLTKENLATGTAKSINELSVGTGSGFADNKAPVIKKIKLNNKKRKIVAKVIVDDGLESSGIAKIDGTYSLFGTKCNKAGICRKITRSGLIVTESATEHAFDFSIKALKENEQLTINVAATDAAGNVGRVKTFEFNLK